MWNLVIAWVATAVISYALRPRGPSAPPAATLSEVNVPTAEEGREIPVLFGTRDIDSPNVAWYGHLGSTAIRKKSGK